MRPSLRMGHRWRSGNQPPPPAGDRVGTRTLAEGVLLKPVPHGGHTTGGRSRSNRQARNGRPEISPASHGETTASSLDGSIDSSSTVRVRASDKRSRRAAKAPQHDQDTFQRYGRQYSKYPRVSAAAMFRTENHYHDSFLGMRRVPKRRKPNMTEDTVFPSPVVRSRLPAQVTDRAL